MTKISKRVWLDIFLFVSMIYLMCYRFVPRIPHEILGTVLIFAIGLHLYWNRESFKIKSIETVLIIVTILAIVSGICLSHEIFKDLIGGAFRKNVLVHKLHASMPYYMMILSGIHIGKYIRFNIPTSAGILIFIAGIWGSMENSLIQHLIFQRVRHAERHPDFSPELFLSIVTMFLMWIIVGYFYKRRRV